MIFSRALHHLKCASAGWSWEFDLLHYCNVWVGKSPTGVFPKKNVKKKVREHYVMIFFFHQLWPIMNDVSWSSAIHCCSFIFFVFIARSISNLLEQSVAHFFKQILQSSRNFFLCHVPRKLALKKLNGCEYMKIIFLNCG